MEKSELESNDLVCKYVRLGRERLERDRLTGHERGLYYDEEAAQHAVDFFKYLKHSKGEWAGEEFTLSAWQEYEIIRPLFGWRRSDGTRRFRVAYIEIPRKNGKSTLLAGIGLYLFMADGEQGAEVYSAATKKDQARIVFEEAKRMLKASPELLEYATIHRDNLALGVTNSFYRPLSADVNSMDGFNIHGAIIDELHAHKTSELWDVIYTGRGSRRQPLMVAITTAGNNRESVCWEQRDYGTKILEQIFDDDSFFVYIAHADDSDDWTKECTWIKANPNYGISVKPDEMREACEKAQRQTSARNSFLQKRLNMWTEQFEAWIPVENWDNCCKPISIEDLKGKSCYLGLDLSNRIDMTALSLLFPLDGGVKRVFPFFFMPEERLKLKEHQGKRFYNKWYQDGFIIKTPGDVIDYDYILQKIKSLGELYSITEIGFDPWNSTQLVTDLQAEGFNVVPLRQGYGTLSDPSKEFEKLILSKHIEHDGNPVFRWMIKNVGTECDAAGNIKPSRKKSSDKIDAVVATIMALARDIVHTTDRSVYEERGILAF